MLGEAPRIIGVFFMKRIAAFFVAAITLVASAAAAPLVMKPSRHRILVDGKAVQFDAYTIGGNNYFKLRDVAFQLNGTSAQFAVGWEPVTNEIHLTTDAPYTPVGGEMMSKGGESQTSRSTGVRIVRDGEDHPCAAYNIGGNNYFKLRDLGEILDFGVWWEEATATVHIESELSYDPDYVGEPETGSEEFEKPQHTRLYLLKYEDDYIMLDYDGERARGLKLYVTRNEESASNLVFAERDIEVTSTSDKEFNFTTWYFRFLLTVAMSAPETVTRSDFPPFKIGSGWNLPSTITAGVDPSTELLPVSGYTPQWIEYNGKRIYNLSPEEKKLADANGMLTVNGIRYFNGAPCINDIFTYWGLNKTLRVFQYEGYWAIEVVDLAV
jgi:hypothetical protein